MAEQAVDPPDPSEQVDLGRFVELVEGLLLGGERKYTRADIVDQTGSPIEEVRQRWQALGFATTDDDQRLFTEADAQAIRDVEALKKVGNIDDDVMLAMTRIIGQTFARLASWQGQVVIDVLTANPEMLAGGADGVADLIEQLTPLVGDLHNFVWRRQLSAYFARVASNAQVGAGIGTEVSMGVGFVDMAGFTTFTRQSSEADLRKVLTRFESLATEVIAAHRGQLVKTIGDEVLFTADRPGDTVRIALDMIETADADDDLPQLRAGLAYGPVVSRLGDVYGQTVNIASRLTGIARPGSILVDAGLHDELENDAQLDLRSLRPVNVRGYAHLRPWRLRRAAT